MQRRHDFYPEDENLYIFIEKKHQVMALIIKEDDWPIFHNKDKRTKVRT